MTQQLGRISGQLLKDNLIRDGIDINFRNFYGDEPLLYLDVVNRQINVNIDNGPESLNITSSAGTTKTTDLVSGNSQVDNLLFSGNIISTEIGTPIQISATGAGAKIISDRMIAGNIIFNDNNITSSSGNILLDTNESTKTIINSSLSMVGNLEVFGDINLDGDLSSASNIIVGNETLDIVRIIPNIGNTLIPKNTKIYNLGGTIPRNRWNDVYTDEIDSDSSMRISNVSIIEDTINRNTGTISINMLSTFPVSIFKEIRTLDLKISGNKISSLVDQNLRFLANGIGTIDLENSTNVTGNLSVDGNITLSGNLRSNSNVIIGNEPMDVVQINVQFDQELSPGTDNLYDLGKNNKRWSNAYIQEWRNIDNLFSQTLYVNNDLKIGGIINEITPLIPGTTISLIPDSGINDIEEIRFEENNITNLSNLPIRLASTGIGYYRISGDNGFVMPSGTIAQRPLPSVSPQGMTRWNTELEQIECFDSFTGTWRRSIGSGDVNIEEMEDYSYFYTLILG
jgi:cytoskeletal protein CcmA (bactofilin family)